MWAGGRKSQVTQWSPCAFHPFSVYETRSVLTSRSDGCCRWGSVNKCHKFKRWRHTVKKGGANSFCFYPPLSMNPKYLHSKWETIKNHSPQRRDWGRGVGWGEENTGIVQSNLRKEKNASKKKESPLPTLVKDRSPWRQTLEWNWVTRKTLNKWMDSLKDCRWVSPIVSMNLKGKLASSRQEHWTPSSAPTRQWGQRQAGDLEVLACCCSTSPLTVLCEGKGATANQVAVGLSILKDGVSFRWKWGSCVVVGARSSMHHFHFSREENHTFHLIVLKSPFIKTLPLGPVYQLHSILCIWNLRDNLKIFLHSVIPKVTKM